MHVANSLPCNIYACRMPMSKCVEFVNHKNGFNHIWQKNNHTQGVGNDHYRYCNLRKLYLSSCEYQPGLRLNIKTVFPRYGDSHVQEKTVARIITFHHELLLFTMNYYFSQRIITFHHELLLVTMNYYLSPWIIDFQTHIKNIFFWVMSVKLHSDECHKISLTTNRHWFR